MFGSHVKLIATFGAVCLIALFLFRLEDPLALSRAAITNLASSPIAIVDDTADIEEALEPAAAEGADEHVKESKRAEEEEPAEPAVVEPSPSSTVSRRPTSPSASKSTTAPKAEPPSSPSHAPALRPERQPHVSPPSSTAQNASESSSGRLIMHMGPDSCGAVSYMTGATNCNLGPPYFHPTNCVARKWSAEQAAECLRGSNIFVVRALRSPVTVARPLNVFASVLLSRVYLSRTLRLFPCCRLVIAWPASTCMSWATC